MKPYGVFVNQKDLHVMRSSPNLAKGMRITCNLIILNPFRQKYNMPQGLIGMDLRTGEWMLQKRMETPK